MNQAWKVRTMTDAKPKRTGRPPRTQDKCVHLHIWCREADADAIRCYAATRGITLGEAFERLVQAAH
jgi:hypothetical protein